jgi:hypothetical protein
VTHLRELTLEELARRNYTEGTTGAYLRIIEDFARYFHRPPDQLGPEHIRAYTAHLLLDRKLSDNTVNQMIGALFLPQDPEAALVWRRDALSEEENSSAGHLESG